MKYTILMLLSCQSQETADYETKVYELLNSVYKRKPNSPIKSRDVVLNINHQLENSVLSIDQNLVERVLTKGQSNNMFNLPNGILKVDNWRNTTTQFSSDQFDQEKIYIPNLHFRDSSDAVDPQTEVFYSIESILFLEDYSVLTLSFNKSLRIVTLFKKESNNYSVIATITDPPLGDE